MLRSLPDPAKIFKIPTSQKFGRPILGKPYILRTGILKLLASRPFYVLFGHIRFRQVVLDRAAFYIDDLTSKRVTGQEN